MCVIIERTVRLHFLISLLLFGTRKAKYSAWTLNPVTVALRKQSKSVHIMWV